MMIRWICNIWIMILTMKVATMKMMTMSVMLTKSVIVTRHSPLGKWPWLSHCSWLTKERRNQPFIRTHLFQDLVSKCRYSQILFTNILFWIDKIQPFLKWDFSKVTFGGFSSFIIILPSYLISKTVYHPLHILINETNSLRDVPADSKVTSI